MPRSSKKKEQPIPKKNEATNKKRKRTEDDVDNKTSNKKIKIGWLRDIKTVLRSAGNRFVHIESGSKQTKAGRRKSNKNKNESEIIINSEDRKDQLGMTLIENSDMPIVNKDLGSQIGSVIDDDERNSCIFDQRENLAGTTTRMLEIEHLSIKPNTQNDLEESCTFKLIQCKASGTMIRLENASSSDNHQIPNNVEGDKNNQNRVTDAVSYENCITGSDLENENNRRMKVEQLIKIIDSDNNNEIEREVEHVDLHAQSSIDIGTLQDTNYTLPAPAVTMKDSVKRYINGFKSNNYFFGTDNGVDNNHSDTGYTFASSHNNDNLMITESNEVDMDMTEFETVESQRSDDSYSNHNFTDYWINPCRENCSAQNVYSINGSNEFHLPSSNNNTIADNDSIEIPQDKIKLPITQAYYDSNTGAYVDPLTLQDNKVQNTTNSFKNTWGSIKNLISRVSGNKGSEDVQDNQPEDLVTQAEEDLHS